VGTTREELVIDRDRLMARGKVDEWGPGYRPVDHDVRRPVRIDGGRDGSDLAAPVLGEHTDAVLAELGYSDSDIAAKRAAKII
jgi:crotonobetainyl-CoA:carnitine CoA-transferase CaiB-like acyl-CoA transferase